MVVDDDGTIVSGTMDVNIAWALSGNGTTPVNENQYFVTSEQRQAGTLDLQGTAASFEAAGTLAHDKTVYDTSGNLIEEVSGTEETSVLWTFQPGTADCASVTGELVAADGKSLMQTALVPDFIFEEDYEAANRLVSQFWAYPVFEDSDVIAAAITELNGILGEVLEGTPDPETILTLVEAAEAIRADLARLDICNDAIPGFSPQQSKTWLSEILTELLGRVLQESGAYTPQDLITILNIGARGGALTGDTYTGFGEALGVALSNALAVDDIDSIYDIAVAAAQYGYQDVYEDAIAVIEESAQ